MTPVIPDEHRFETLGCVTDGDRCIIFDPEKTTREITSDTYVKNTEHRQ